MKKWKIYGIIMTVVLVFVLIGLCLYFFLFKESITETEAQNIAYQYAGVNASNVTILSIQKDREDREYEVRFYDDMYEYDKYMMVKLNEVTKEILAAYEDNNYQEIYKIVNNFVSFTLSNFYLDFTKDILYIEKADSKVRRSVQTVLYNTLMNLIKLLAPILPYTSEEVYRHVPGLKLESVHLERMPEVLSYENALEILEKWNVFFEVKDDVYKALEEARNEKLIGKGLEAKVYLHVSGKYKEVIDSLKDSLKQLLIVSEVVLTDEELPKYNVSHVKVEKFVGHKCERCWNYFNEDEMEGDICHRCAGVIK